jgi:hypothetical protein
VTHRKIRKPDFWSHRRATIDKAIGPIAHFGGTMDSELAAPRSRRALLTAAAAAGGALVASAALPMAAMAHDIDDVQKGVDNPTTATTTITDSGNVSTAFAGHATGAADVVTGAAGAGLEGTSALGAGVFAWSINAPSLVPDASVLSHTGVYGFSPAGDGITTFGAGVWGDSEDAGVYGSGTYGVIGNGAIGVIGETNASDNGLGVVGDASGSAGGIGVLAFGDAGSTALHAEGKVHFSRSGRVAMSSGHSSKAVTLVGGTGGSKVFAVLATTETGRWVRAVVPATGKFTIYLNTTLSTAAVVSWFVLD